MNAAEICKENSKSMCFNKLFKEEEYNNEFKNDLDTDNVVDSSDTSAKASSSSMYDSITNISNSHSTPEDNFSENALMSPINKNHVKYENDAKDESISPNQYFPTDNVKFSNNHSIDDTIESVLNKFRIENDSKSTKNLTPVKSQTFAEVTITKPYSSIQQNYSHYHIQQSQMKNSEPTPCSTLNTQCYSKLNYPQYTNGCNYGGFYINPQIPQNGVNSYTQYARQGDKNKYIYYPYYLNPQFRQQYIPTNVAYSANQFYYPNAPNYPVYQKSLKSNYDQYTMIEDFSNPHGYGNFKIPNTNASINSLEPVPTRKKRSSDCKLYSQSKKRKVTQHLSNATMSTYDELLYKLKVQNFNSLLSNPKIAPSLTLLPPQGFVDTKSKITRKSIKYRKYKSSIYTLKRKRSYRDKDNDKYLKKYIDDSTAGNIINSTLSQDTENLDIIPSSPYHDYAYSLLKHLTHSTTENNMRPVSPVISHTSTALKTSTEPICLPESRKTANVPKVLCPTNCKTTVVSYNDTEAMISREPDLYDSDDDHSSFNYEQIPGSFLKRTKINGKTFSNIHIEEALSMSVLSNCKKSLTCSNCSAFLYGISFLRKKDIELDLESKNEEYYFCTDVCYIDFKQKCSDSCFDRKLAANNSVQSAHNFQVIIKNSQLNKQLKNSKKVCDFEQYVRRRFPSEGQNDISPRNGSQPFLPTSSDTHITHSFRHMGSKYSYFAPDKLQVIVKEIPKEDQNFILNKFSFSYQADGLVDGRRCVLCQEMGDAVEDMCGRLINIDADNWIHLNCALWCFEVFETVSGSLMDVSSSLQKALKTICTACQKPGAGIQCYRSKCPSIYHVPCAYKTECVFYTDRGMYCSTHAILNHPMHLPTLKADRRVIIHRDESLLVANTVSSDEHDAKPIFRTGALILNSIGQLLPEQLISGKFNSSSIIYPVGFHATRIYWSFNTVNQRCRYECFIIEENNMPLFKVIVNEKDEEYVFTDVSCDDVWKIILNKIAKLRESIGLTKLFPMYLSGEQLYGLTEPHIIRVIESLPGVEMIKNYAFKFGKMQLITEMPLAINPTGSARTEPKLRTYVRRTQNENSNNKCSVTQCGVLKAKFSQAYQYDFINNKTIAGNSRSLQYKKMKYEWMNNVILSRSKIQGLGLFAAKDFEKSTILIEYIGELIRSEVGNRRESMYQARNNSIYMFRLNEDVIIDATAKGGLARYINHSCNPNCVAELLSLECGERIVITTKQRVQKGEELTYDYKFDFEEDNSVERIPCLCGSINCRKWMN